MSKESNLAIVIVTYKRQELLQVMFDSLRALTEKPKFIVLVDNENSQETSELTKKLQSDLSTLTEVSYVPMAENTGGAGGFSKGVQVAYDLGADWVWLMDDDVKIFPESIAALEPWLADAVKNENRAIQIRRKNYDGSDFYWQYDFKNHLGIPNPIAPAAFASNETSKNINTMCFEGGLFHRSLIEDIGLPDSRFFIYWDDTIYGYLSSKVTQPLLINEMLMQRTRTLNNLKLGKIRKLNSTSDMTRYYIMRNRGYMAQYFKLNGDYNPIVFGFGTFLTFSKEVIRLALSDDFRKGFKILRQGMKDAKKIRKDKNWQPMKAIQQLAK